MQIQQTNLMEEMTLFIKQLDIRFGSARKRVKQNVRCIYTNRVLTGTT